MSDDLKRMVLTRYRSTSEQKRYMVRASEGLLAWEKSVVSRFMAVPGTLLDVGCGGGREALALDDLGHEVTAVDIAEEQLEHARVAAEQAGRDIRFQHLNGTDLPFDGATFEYVVIWSQVLGNVPGAQARKRLLAECARVLRPAGVLSLSVHNRDVCGPIACKKGLIEEEPDVALEEGDYVLVDDDGSGTPCYWHYFTRGELVGLCQAAGFVVEACGLARDFGQDDWDTVWVCVGRRK